jgi:hypothetical protein
MLSSEFISKTSAAKFASVSRQAIYEWIAAGRVKVDAKGRILREPFERDHASYVLVTRLRDTINALPPAALPFILIEVLGADYVRALGNIAAGQSNKTVEGKMSGDVQS